MLHEVGIDSEYVLISTYRGTVDPALPSPHFNHAILAIEVPRTADSGQIGVDADGEGIAEEGNANFALRLLEPCRFARAADCIGRGRWDGRGSARWLAGTPVPLASSPTRTTSGWYPWRHALLPA